MQARLGGETAANANRIFAELPGPNALEADTNGRKDGNVQYRQQSFGDLFRGSEIERDSAEAEIRYDITPDPLPDDKNKEMPASSAVDCKDPKNANNPACKKK